MRYYTITLFNTGCLTHSQPIRVSKPTLNEIKDYCFDSDYKWTFTDDSLMDESEVQEVLRDAHTFSEELLNPH